jgi:RHS repeat-associated protein
VVNHLTYDSFGNLVGQSNAAVDTRYRFTGREFDGETGLYYYRARYYDAQVGRFIGTDPIGFNGGDANLYRYVGNNTTNATDPNGLASARLTALLNLACAGASGNTCDKYPPARHYSQAMATARAWFYAITTSSVGFANINRNPSISRPSPSTLPRWTLTLPLVDDDPLKKDLALRRCSVILKVVAII